MVAAHVHRADPNLKIVTVMVLTTEELQRLLGTGELMVQSEHGYSFALKVAPLGATDQEMAAQLSADLVEMMEAAGLDLEVLPGDVPKGLPLPKTPKQRM